MHMHATDTLKIRHLLFAIKRGNETSGERGYMLLHYPSNRSERR